MRLFRKRACLIATAAVFVIACASDVTKVGDNSGGATLTGGSGGADGSSGAGGNAGNANNIAGVWDIYGSVRPNGHVVTGTLTVDDAHFLLQLNSGAMLSYGGEPATVRFVRPFTRQDNVYTVTHTYSQVELGAIMPKYVGGSWTFTHPGVSSGRCEADLRPASFNAHCVNVLYAPSHLPNLNHSLSAVRSTVLPSVFGDLGGVWQLQSDGGQGGRCTARFEGSEFTASCVGTWTEFDGALTFTLGNGVASGSSSEGLEISAVRR